MFTYLCKKFRMILVIVFFFLNNYYFEFDLILVILCWWVFRAYTSSWFYFAFEIQCVQNFNSPVINFVGFFATRLHIFAVKCIDLNSFGDKLKLEIQKNFTKNNTRKFSMRIEKPGKEGWKQCSYNRFSFFFSLQVCIRSEKLI